MARGKGLLGKRLLSPKASLRQGQAETAEREKSSTRAPQPRPSSPDHGASSAKIANQALLRAAQDSARKICTIKRAAHAGPAIPRDNHASGFCSVDLLRPHRLGNLRVLRDRSPVRVASGVRSRGPRPVPPAVTIRLAPRDAHAVIRSQICSTSSGTSAVCTPATATLRATEDHRRGPQYSSPPRANNDPRPLKQRSTWTRF